MFFKTLTAVSLLVLPAMAADPQAWRSADGRKQILGEFVKRDDAGVTIRRTDRREVTIPLQKLHPEDRARLDAEHPLPGHELPPAGSAFDKLLFGDSRAQVLEKLKTSEFVQLTIPETLLGRTGLNGVFHTRRKIGGLDASLAFDWSDDGRLKEVTLQTASLPANDFESRLLPCWREFIKLLSSLHGQPINESDKLDITPIPDGGMSATHLWKLEQRGTAMLGAARQEESYQIAVRFTTEEVKPVVIPATKPAGKMSQK